MFFAATFLYTESPIHPTKAAVKNISLGNKNRKEWELTVWEWKGMGMLKYIPDHLY